ncbi:MAG: glycosyltransferase family 39 protein [Verrucomicrobia bacterium]|nr:glycosyltransferase family 39 protein [Verrucomicrobiota bacterium]
MLLRFFCYIDSKILSSARPLIFLSVLVIALPNLFLPEVSEPFFNNDETRHVMTGVFFRDFFADLPISEPKEYTIHYYLQYPALGLLVWPPLFHFIEGGVMLVLGTSIIVSRALITAFALLAFLYLFKLVSHTHKSSTAALAVLMFGSSSLIITYANQVMLEMPMLACSLAAIYYFVRYVDQQNRLDVVLATLATVFAVLVRYNGVSLVPIFICILLLKKRLDLLRSREVLVCATLGSLFVLPIYGFNLMNYGWVQLNNQSARISHGLSEFLSQVDFWYYPSRLPEQIGWLVLVPALIGLSFCMNRDRRKCSWPYLAIIIVTYAMYTPMSLPSSRYAIFWIPAFAVFAAEGMEIILNCVPRPQIRILILIMLICGVLATNLRAKRRYVRGYEEAAQYVTSHTQDSNFVLFDGDLDGNFIYQIRRNNRSKDLWVLRGDKLFYSFIVYPDVAYKEYSRSGSDILDIIFKYDPEYIVVEEPRRSTIPMADSLRAVLKRYPERFELANVVPIQSNLSAFNGIDLKIYRNLLRNEVRENSLSIELQGLRRTISTTIRN